MLFLKNERKKRENVFFCYFLKIFQESIPPTELFFNVFHESISPTELLGLISIEKISTNQIAALKSSVGGKI